VSEPESEWARNARLHAERDAAIAASSMGLAGVREYAEGYPVTIHTEPPYIEPRHGWQGPHESRVVIKAVNEGGHNLVLIDLKDLIGWLHENRPDLLVRE
jgi:hypothetical protein